MLRGSELENIAGVARLAHYKGRVVISCGSTNSASVRTVTSHLGIVNILDSRYLYISSIEQVGRGGMRQCREIKIKPGSREKARCRHRSCGAAAGGRAPVSRLSAPECHGVSAPEC